MLNETNIEQRLQILEKQVAQLQAQSQQKSDSCNWLQQVMGSISDEEFFLKALEYGRIYRQSDKPMDDNNDDV